MPKDTERMGQPGRAPAWRGLWLRLALLTLLAIPAPAAAQTPSPLMNWQYSVGELLRPLMGPEPEWQIYAGGGASLQPIYEGSRRYHVLPAPIIDIHYHDRAFLSAGEGLGVNLLRGTFYRAGVALTYDLGRAQSDDPHLRGLGDIGAAPEAKLFADFALLPVIVDLNLRHAIGGHDGLIGDIGAHVPLPLASDLFLFAGPSFTFADRRYMQSYFGVTPSQSARSGLAPFAAHGGAKRVGFGTSLVYQITPDWLLATDAAAQRLLGAAASSPVTLSRTEFTIDTGFVHKF